MLQIRPEKDIVEALRRVKNDKYVLAVAVSKRADRILAGDKPLIDLNPKDVKASDIAIKEIAMGLLDVKCYV